MSILPKQLTAAGILLFAGLAFGQGAGAAVDPEVAKQIKARLQASNPGATFGEVIESPIAGLYEVPIANTSLFVTADGSHFVVGDLYQTKAGELLNLTEQRRATEREAIMDAQALEDMIVFSPEGEPKAHIYVFTDVDCGYCRKLHDDVPELNRRGIEVRYLAFPRSGPDSLSSHRIATAWCAEDRNQTLTDLKKGKNVPLNVCKNNPVAAHFKLGNEVINVRGTPTIIMQDGTLVPGYVPPDAMAQALNI